MCYTMSASFPETLNKIIWGIIKDDREGLNVNV